MNRIGKVVAVLGALALGACGTSTPAGGTGREINISPEAPVAVDVSGMNVPISFDGLPVFDPGWVTMPQYSSGIYFGARVADDALEYLAISTTGEALWSTERPLTCTGFVVAETSIGQPIAVLLDTAVTDEALGANSASAYDLETGDVLWGPVNVPGTYQGPGLVFAASPPDFMGESGARIALDPDTGDVIANEADSDTHIIGDFSGTLLLADDDVMFARASSGETLWTLDVAGYDWSTDELRADVDELASENYALLTINHGAGPVIDLHDGTVVNPAAREMGEDPLTGAVVVLDEEGLQSYDSTGLLWSLSAQQDTTIQSVGGVFVYLRNGDTVRAHNVLTGAIAQAYYYDGTGTILVPTHLSPDGAGLLFDADGHVLMVSVPGSSEFPFDS